MTTPTSRSCAALTAACLTALPACSDPESPRLELSTRGGELTITLRDDGRIDLRRSDGSLILRGGWAEALVEVGSDGTTLTTKGCAGAWEGGGVVATQPYFAGLEGLTFLCPHPEATLRWQVSLDTRRDTVITRLQVVAHTPLTVLRLTPMATGGADGGLFVGPSPTQNRILDNGSYVAADTDVHLYYPEKLRVPVIDALFPFSGRGNVLANWNHAIADLNTGESWIAGALTIERAFPTFGTSYLPGEAPVADGRVGYGELYADHALIFDGKQLDPGQTVASEVTYLDPVPPDPFTGLEDYADAVSRWQDFTVWTKRDGGRPVPNGWNSWTGSSSTGGLGTTIDEALLGECLDVMAREFEPFGMDYFQIDDGYQQADGDWIERPDRFPSGMAAFSDQIIAAGLIPGIWISAFTVGLDSQLAADHPDWLAHAEDNVLTGLLEPDAGEGVFDLSNPEVVDWLGATMRRYRDDWKMGWVKLDFAYQAFPYRPRARPELTAMEAYRGAVSAIRDNLGDDVFYMGIGLMGVNYGVVDAMRTTLDTGPHWEEDQAFNLFGEGGSFKAGVKAGARRYYLHNRVWVNHHDLMFFRTDASRPDEVVTLEEATTFASFIGLTGSIVKFGEDLRTLTPEQIQVWRKLLPAYPPTARPLDLFERHYPEIYHLPIRGTLAGSPAHWTVVGLLNWGRNYDYTARFDPVEMADAARTYTVALADLDLGPEETYLAREFWTGAFLGEVSGKLEHTVAAHGHAVIALRKRAGRPQLLGHNRHLTQGATDLVAERWDDDARTLQLTFQVDASGAGAVPFEYAFDVYVPEGYTLADAAVGTATVTKSGPVLTIALTPSEAGEFRAELRF